MAMFCDRALALRLPEEGLPTDGPLKLRAVDPSKGMLIDPFAVEEMFGQGHYRLLKEGDEYRVNPPIETSGYTELVPPESFAAPEGAPVAALPTAGEGPARWLIASGQFAMQADPLAELGELADLRPATGDTVTIDGKELTFAAQGERTTRPKGGVTLNKGLQKQKDFTLLAFTVLKVSKATTVKLNAPYTPAGRVQVVLAGQPVRHKQVLSLDAGVYPLLVVARLGIKWNALGVAFEAPKDEAEVQAAREQQKEIDRRLVQQREMAARRAKQGPPPLIFPYEVVPEARRDAMLWIADRKLAEAWANLHNRDGREMDTVIADEWPTE
jgi:hypothetical protein